MVQGGGGSSYRSRSYTVKPYHLQGSKGGRSKFLSEVNPNSYIAKALRSRRAKVVKNSSDSWSLVADMGRVIGTKGQTRIKVVFTRTGKIVTSYPIK